MQRTWKQSPNNQYTTYVYTQKSPLTKITRAIGEGGRPLRLPWIRHCIRLQNSAKHWQVSIITLNIGGTSESFQTLLYKKNPSSSVHRERETSNTQQRCWAFWPINITIHIKWKEKLRAGWSAKPTFRLRSSWISSSMRSRSWRLFSSSSLDASSSPFLPWRFCCSRRFYTTLSQSETLWIL